MPLMYKKKIINKSPKKSCFYGISKEIISCENMTAARGGWVFDR